MLNTLIVAVILNEFFADKLNINDEKGKFKKVLLMIPISIVLWGLKEIPTVGTWISTIIFFCGVGTVILYQFDKRKKNDIISE